MAGYSENPLIKKLGIKPGFVMLVWHEPQGYWDWISPLPKGVEVKTGMRSGAFDFIHLFARERKVLEKELPPFMKAIKSNGMVWVSWLKKSSGIESDLDGNIVRNFALKNGWVDVKVCAVNEHWSGLKLVIPVKDRKR
ncbi:MAG: DUF3052 domain-containing protein [Cytophagales bacterium]|nr:DUF3052 domain-containing protein [Cytophagales bacterium]